MIKLYGMGSPNVIKAVIMLEELEEPYAFERVNVLAGEQFSDAFKTLNPNSKVPVLVDERAKEEPVTVFESGAILMYLAETSGRFWPQDIRERYRVIEWLMFQMAGFGPISGQAIHFTRAHKEAGYAQDRFVNELTRLTNVVEARLADTAYIAGNDYSIADIALFPWVRTLVDFFPDLVDGAHTQDWYNAISTRPAVERAVQLANDLATEHMTIFRACTPEMKDRYFGRSSPETS